MPHRLFTGHSQSGCREIVNNYAEGAFNKKQSQSEFWIALQRLWSFDDPKARWSRLLKNCLRQERSDRHLQSEDAREMKELLQMSEFYGSGGATKQGFDLAQTANMVTSILMALTDLARFQAGCLNVQSSNAALFAAPTLMPAAWCELLEQIVETRELDAAEKRYLYFCACVNPYWQGLLHDGPWSGDERGRFVADFWQSVADDQIAASSAVGAERFREWEKRFNDGLERSRVELPGSFLPAHLVLVEGATEQILFPRLAELLQLGWHKRALAILAAGGAKQVCKRYASLKEKVKLRIDCVLDGDVSEQAREIAMILRPDDRLLVLDAPSIEETFTLEQLTFFCNQYFQASIEASIYQPVVISDLQGQTNQDCLERLWRKRTQASFDKIGFARTVAENLHEAEQIPIALRQIMEKIAVRTNQEQR